MFVPLHQFRFVPTNRSNSLSASKKVFTTLTFRWVIKLIFMPVCIAFVRLRIFIASFSFHFSSILLSCSRHFSFFLLCMFYYKQCLKYNVLKWFMWKHTLVRPRIWIIKSEPYFIWTRNFLTAHQVSERVAKPGERVNAFCVGKFMAYLLLYCIVKLKCVWKSV